MKELSEFGKCLGMAGDVRSMEDCKRVVKNTVDQFGSLDVLINGAAGNFLASAASLSSNGFKTVMEIDALGTFNMSQCAFNFAMKQQKKINESKGSEFWPLSQPRSKNSCKVLGRKMITSRTSSPVL